MAITQLYRLPDLERLSGIPQRTWRHYMATGRLRYSRIGRRIMVTEAELQAFLDANQVEVRSPLTGARVSSSEAEQLAAVRPGSRALTA
jgi:hypothetical protein